MTSRTRIGLNRLLLILAISAMHFTSSAQLIMYEEFEMILGPVWTGELTYKDYSSEKMVSIKTELEVEKVRDGYYYFKYFYPDESERKTSRIRIDSRGLSISNNPIVDRQVLEDGRIVITTTDKGKDNRKKAKFRYTYTLGKDSFSSKKEVKYNRGEEYFMRNEYSFTRDSQPEPSEKEKKKSILE